MSRINTNVNSLIAQRILGQQNSQLSQSLERLSTGLAINRGSDDPAGLIASERLRSEKVALGAAIGNAERADQVLNIAEGGLREVNTLLLELQGLVGQSANEAGLSREEKEANQLQIDSILQTITRLSDTATFEGVKLLNGTFDFAVTGQNANILDFNINTAKLEFGDTRTVNVLVTASAQHAGLYLSAGAQNLNLAGATSAFTIEVAGVKGSREFTFASGTVLSAVVDSVNTFTSVTGVSAAVVQSGASDGIFLKSQGFGTNEFVSVDIINDAGLNGAVHQLVADNEAAVDVADLTALAAVTNPIRDEGQDVGAIINGINATSDGRQTRVSTDFLDLSLDIAEAGATALGSITAFTITGGGARFNLGPQVNITNQLTIGIQNSAARHLGRTVDSDVTYLLDDLGSGKALNVVDGNIQVAQRSVDTAIGEISTLRGRIGSFQKNVIEVTIRSLGTTLENTSAAESAIRDTDFAAETAKLTRGQILVNAATNILGIANSRPQNVLSLLQ